MVEMFLPNFLSSRLWEWVAKILLVGYRLGIIVRRLLPPLSVGCI